MDRGDRIAAPSAAGAPIGRLRVRAAAVTRDRGAGTGTRAGSGARLRVAWLVAAGLTALGVGVLAYLADRAAPPALLAPFAGALRGRHLFGSAAQWLPSLVHPFAFSLFTAAALPPGSRWGYGACAAWCALNLAFEAGQHPGVSARLAGALVDGAGSTGPTRALADYFVRGTWDRADIVAAILGAFAAACALRIAQRSSRSQHA